MRQCTQDRRIPPVKRMLLLLCVLLLLCAFPGLAEGNYADALWARQPCEEIGPCTEGLIAVKKNGLWGYVNTKGNMVIPCQYEEAMPFSDGLAIVQWGEEWGVINTSGQWQFSAPDGQWMFSVNDSIGFVEGMAMVYEKNSEGEPLYGYVDKTGTLVVPCQYLNAYAFSEGLAAVYNSNTGRGYIDKTGKVVIPCQYTDAGDFVDGWALVRTYFDFSNPDPFFINSSGKKVFSCDYRILSPFSDGLAPVYVKSEDEYSYGFIDKTGKLVFTIEEGIHYNDSYHDNGFSDGFVVVRNDEHNFGYLDKKGNLAIPRVYRYAESFVDGYAMVEKNHKYSYIDSTGKVVFPFMFDYDECYWSDGYFTLLMDGELVILDKKLNRMN